MALTVLEMNAEGAFGKAEQWRNAVAFIEAQNPDVAFLGESHWERQRGPLGANVPRDSLAVHDSVQALRALGYSVLAASDNDSKVDRRGRLRPDRTGWMLLVRRGLGHAAIIRMGTRDGGVAEVTDPETGETARIATQHYDDIDNETRLGHVRDLPADTDVLTGDLNEMHGEDRVARFLQKFKPLAALIPTWQYDFTHVRENAPDQIIKRIPYLAYHKVKTVLHLFKRLVGMATGDVMSELDKRGLRDADPTHQRTMAKAPVQLDHTMVGPRVEVLDFRVIEDPSFETDHRPHITTMRIRKDALDLAA